MRIMNFLFLKKAIINPSFVVAIVPTDSTQKKVDGYIDEKTGKYIITNEEEVSEDLTDEFSDIPQLKQPK